MTNVKEGRDTQLRLMAQRAGATVEISDPAQRVVQELAAELLDVRQALRDTLGLCNNYCIGYPADVMCTKCKKTLVILDGE